MRIRMDKAVEQNLLQVGTKQFTSETGSIYLHQTQRAQLGDLLAGYVFHREHA